MRLFHLLAASLLGAGCDTATTSASANDGGRVAATAPAVAPRETKGGPLTPDERAFLQRMIAREEAKAAVRANPAKYLRSGTLENGPHQMTFGAGVIGTSSTRTIEFNNTSEFDLAIVAGRITFYGQSGEELGSVPFKAAGEVQAGRTAKVAIDAGDVSGATKSVNAVVAKVHILE